MSSPSYAAIARDGLWHNNAGLVQLLGLCPLLAISSTVVNALGLGLATLLTVTVSNLAVSSLRRGLPNQVRIPVFVLIIASIVTAIEMISQAFFLSLYQALGIFIPLIVTNCAILGRAEAFASRQPALPAAVDGLAVGAGFLGVLVALGGLRELVANGTLFQQAHLLFGETARGLGLTVIPGYDGFLLAALPPGAFFGLGALIALKNVIDRRHAERAAATPVREQQARGATP